ncbi:AbiEi antitoxin N-terminal domain-containing protein [uncultured Boseongicola sp.]|jgi:predicted transcriptional regulator of viral defense system|uniref:type IV toxin-antitoxin system AbiEi family antitoxin domain-containing protein n=1 Tax=uncultured Boseongicola sp. TaxID=1648499 RepID=UPI0026289710|nr:AbiEi antitoxin N-terminal domain-containing protein [uncultured Boseongicola sp.]
MPRDLTQRQRLLEYLKSYAPARARDLEDIGVTAAAISRSVQSGEVLRLGRGLYGLPDSAPNTHETLIEVAKRAPKAVICLTSALAFHGLTDQLPRRVWIAIGAKGWEPKITYPKIRAVRFREPYFSSGVEEHRLGGTTIKMYTIPKTLADAFRNQRLVDRSIAIEALKAAVEQRKATPSAIADAAREYSAWNQMRPYLEAVTSNG